jgi:hypothetical protein
MAANLASPIVSALNHRLRTNENGIAEFHRFCMLENHSWTDLEPMPTPLTHRTQKHATHDVVEWEFTIAVTRKKTMQIRRRVVLPKCGREIPLPRGIRLYALFAERGRDLPDCYPWLVGTMTG